MFSKVKSWLEMTKIVFNGNPCVIQASELPENSPAARHISIMSPSKHKNGLFTLTSNKKPKLMVSLK